MSPIPNLISNTNHNLSKPNLNSKPSFDLEVDLLSFDNRFYSEIRLTRKKDLAICQTCFQECTWSDLLLVFWCRLLFEALVMVLEFWTLEYLGGVEESGVRPMEGILFAA